MKSEIDDIELLARAILVEAQEDADQIRAEAKEAAEAIHKHARAQAESERQETLARANQDAERLRSQASATAQLKARSTQLEQREKILDSVFDEVRKQLGTIRKRPDYKAIAVMLAHEALAQLRVNEAEIHADHEARKALNLDELGREFNGQFLLGSDLEEGTGVVVSALGGKLNYDNTLETRLSRLQGTLRSAVYKVLMGEQA